MTDESIGLAFDQESKQAMESLEADVRPLISEMTSAELRDALKLLAETEKTSEAGAAVGGPRSTSIKFEDNGRKLSHSELVNKMIKIVIEKAEKGETMPPLGKLAKPSIVSQFSSSFSLFFNSALKSLHLKSDETTQDNAQARGSKQSLTISELQKRAEEQQTRTFRITFVLASIFFMFRLWYSGNMSTLFHLIQNGDVGGSGNHDDEEGERNSFNGFLNRGEQDEDDGFEFDEF